MRKNNMRKILQTSVTALSVLILLMGMNWHEALAFSPETDDILIIMDNSQSKTASDKSDEIEIVTESESEPEADAEAETESEIASEDVNDKSDENSNAWKNAYINYINGLEATNMSTEEWAQYEYALIYVDDDDVPELYVEGLSEAEGDRICTLGNDGQVVECILSRTYGSSYIERSGLICNFNGNMDYFYLNFYQLSNGVFTQLSDAYGAEVVEWDENGNSTENYTWNDSEVTKEEFYANWKAIMDLDALVNPWEDVYTADDMISLIVSYDIAAVNVEESENESEIILNNKLADLVATYGVFESSQSGVMQTHNDVWFEPSGIMSANIEDFDMDGTPEMLVCVSEYCDHYNDGHYHIMMYMWEVENGIAVLADSCVLGAYIKSDYSEDSYQEVIYSASNWSEELISVNILFSNGICYIICEDQGVAAVFADGSWQSYWALEYTSNSFQYVCSFTQTEGGSSDFQYTGYRFENGQCTGSDLYYSEWYETPGLYDDFRQAIVAYFEDYGITINESFNGFAYSDDYERIFTSFLSPEADYKNGFEFMNKRTSLEYSADYSTTTAYFTATLTRGTELLNEYLNNETDIQESGENDSYSDAVEESEVVILIE